MDDTLELHPMDWTGPTPAPTWEEELASIAPRSERLTWLRLVWQPGDPWEPVHRWFIYEMHPGPLIMPMVLPDLEGPNPRTFNYYDAERGAFIRTRPCMIDRMQWELYQETRCWGRPLWVVQGSSGGHLRRFTHAQSVASAINGGWKEPPAPGDLPYAEPDARTFDMLRRLDLLRAYDKLGDFETRSREQREAEAEARDRDARAGLWEFLLRQQDEFWDRPEHATVLRKLYDGLPIGVTDRRAIDPDAIRNRFIMEDEAE